MRKVFKTPIVIWVIAIIIVAGMGALVALRKPSKPAYDVYSVKFVTVTQEVSVTGIVVPIGSADLEFNKSGRVVKIAKKVGDVVNVGDIIVEIDTAQVRAQRLQAQAALLSQQAQLASLQKGARPEEIAIKQGQVTTAQVSLNESKKNLQNNIRSAYTVSDDGVRNVADQIFINPRTDSPQILFIMADSQLELNIKTQRYTVERMLNLWSASLALFTDASDSIQYSHDAEANLNQVKALLDQAALAVNGLSPYGTITQANITGWKTAISGARTSVNTAIAVLSNAEDAWRGAVAGLQIAQDQLVLTQAGATKEQLDSQLALVDQAIAQVQAIDAQLEEMYIRAPFAGIVTRQDAKLGETMSLGKTVVSIMAKQGFEIDAYIVEADIAKVRINNIASVTLDAYGSDTVFKVRVATIAPDETTIEGVSTYKTTLYFSEQDSRLKSGMTANCDILTAQKDNVLAVPQRVIISKDHAKFVNVLEGTNVREITVETGIRGTNGLVEIVSGIHQGMQIITNP